MKTLLLALLLLPGPASASVNGKIKEIAAAPGLKNASWGLSVKDAASGRDVAAHSPSQNMVPASILKVFTTAAALEKFGPGHRFVTRLYRGGKIDNGFLNGNLYIKGGGDPSLGSQLLPGAQPLDDVFKAWTAALRAEGVNVINGAVLADDTAFDAAQAGSWSWEDIGNYYAAQPSALTVNDGLYKLFLKPSDKVGGEAAVLRTEPYIEGLTFEDHMKTGPAGSGDNGYIYAFPGQYRAVLRGSIPQGSPEFAIKGALPDPALFAAQSFGRYLAKAGVNANKKPGKGAAPDSGLELVAETVSVPLRDVVKLTNKRSFNLYAELLLRHLGGGDPDAGLGAVKAFLASAGADVSELDIVDGCGLSARNTVKPSNFTDLLVALRKKKYFEDFNGSLVFPGDPDATGHLPKMGKGTALEKNLRLKSGSLNGVRAYTGYLTTKRGRVLAFTSMMNGYSCPPASLDKLHESLLLELYNNY